MAHRSPSRLLLRWLSTLTLLGLPLHAATPDDLPTHPAQKIWDHAHHNAFTDLLEWEGQLYCAFREGTDHIPSEDNTGDGTIRILTSPDGQTWTSFAHLSTKGRDLRDPKLSIHPDGRLMLLLGSSNYDGKKLLDRFTCVTFLEKGATTFAPLTRVELDPSIRTHNDWLWRVTWHRGTAYGVVYQIDQKPWGLHLVQSPDGIHYDLLKTFHFPSTPNEALVRFGPGDQMRLLVRNELHGQGRQGLAHFGLSQPPYTDWAWKDLTFRLGGPELLQLPNGKWLLATRDYHPPVTTVLGELRDDGTFHPQLRVPSQGDTSYAGLVLRGDELLMSYYSQHESGPGQAKTAIYFTSIPLSKLP